MNQAEEEALFERATRAGLDPADVDRIRAVFESYAYVSHVIEHQRMGLGRLRKLIFGSRTEKTADVLNRDPSSLVGSEAGAPVKPEDGNEQVASSPVAASGAPTEPQASPDTPEPTAPRPKRKGHGRRGADDHVGARRVSVAHSEYQAGDPCPACQRGTLYDVAAPGVLIRFIGQPPLQSTVYELQKLRCALCGQIFTAAPPPGVGSEKYDATSTAMIALLKYGSGLPFHRLERLQENLGVPLPASTQWAIVESGTGPCRPAFDELLRQAAQGEVLYNDDTTVRILERMGERARKRILQAGPDEEQPPDRTGLFTSGVVATRDGRRVALFFSGTQHAGENLQDVLRQRAADLPPPIQMCDALSRNRPGELQTVVANCLAHARRQFVDLVANFPDECTYVLEALEVVYANDAEARRQGLTPEERLQFHQTQSGPTMERLREWLKRQIDEKQVEPHSGLGAAIDYFRKHWEKLTLFLRVPKAPLDNNLVERALKKAILHRKNSMFYLTQNGADAGDLYMSLIYTCELNRVNPFDYLTELQRHAADVAAAPTAWLPWNYPATMAAAS